LIRVKMATILPGIGQIFAIEQRHKAFSAGVMGRETFITGQPGRQAWFAAPGEPPLAARTSRSRHAPDWLNAMPSEYGAVMGGWRAARPPARGLPPPASG
jgi:hypothetical protein